MNIILYSDSQRSKRSLSCSIHVQCMANTTMNSSIPIIGVERKRKRKVSESENRRKDKTERDEGESERKKHACKTDRNRPKLSKKIVIKATTAIEIQMQMHSLNQ